MRGGRGVVYGVSGVAALTEAVGAVERGETGQVGVGFSRRGIKSGPSEQRERGGWRINAGGHDGQEKARGVRRKQKDKKEILEKSLYPLVVAGAREGLETERI